MGLGDAFWAGPKLVLGAERRGTDGRQSEAGRREWKGYSGTGKVSLR